jgi:ATP-dependent DNA helicase RecG
MKYDILVSTTVVEVGVDVPNATADANRGRGQVRAESAAPAYGAALAAASIKVYSYLVTSTSAKPTERLRHIEKSNDGFYLAEVDLTAARSRRDLWTCAARCAEPADCNTGRHETDR